MRQSSARFRVGDRIVNRYMLSSLPPGRPGTIVAIFHSAPGFYDVEFDQSNARHIIEAADMERLADSAEDSASS